VSCVSCDMHLFGRPCWEWQHVGPPTGRVEGPAEPPGSIDPIDMNGCLDNAPVLARLSAVWAIHFGVAQLIMTQLRVCEATLGMCARFCVCQIGGCKHSCLLCVVSGAGALGVWRVSLGEPVGSVMKEGFCSGNCCTECVRYQVCCGCLSCV
jgi:hypothetical protein